MKQKLLFLFFAVFGIAISFSQNDTLRLDAVRLSDTKLKQLNNNNLKVLKDSILKTKGVNATEFLRFNTPIYFKENGYGMVSSPAFRGTTAQQTAVIWNGININSKLNGQTDFNVLNLDDFDEVAIKSGGNSIADGSGAIGGSIHLINKLKFYKHFKNQVAIGLGSFNTQRYAYKGSVGNSKHNVSATVNHVKSDNDYEYLNTDKFNENGEFNNTNFAVNFGYFLAENHILKYYNQTTFSNRNLAGSLLAVSNSKYEDRITRNLLKWTYLNERFTSNLSVAYLYENYKYFVDKDSESFSFGKVNTLLLNYDFDYKISNKSNLRAVLQNTNNRGEGTSFSQPKNNTFSSALYYKNTLTNKLNIVLQARKDFNPDFKTPIVFGAKVNFQATKNYGLGLTASKDFRTPTFNDLYWQPGGNLNLKSEESYQLDLSQQLQFKNLQIRANAFIIDIENLIQWQPNENGFWSPMNVANVLSKGVELSANFKYKSLELSGNYSYTDSQNRDTKKQLVYVPFHKITGSLAYYIKGFSAYYQHLFNGEVFIPTRKLEHFSVGNFGINYKLQTKQIVTYKLGVVINNIFNTYYENVFTRPMPNRNFNFNLTFNF